MQPLEFPADPFHYLEVGLGIWILENIKEEYDAHRIRSIPRSMFHSVFKDEQPSLFPLAGVGAHAHAAVLRHDESEMTSLNQ